MRTFAERAEAVLAFTFAGIHNVPGWKKAKRRQEHPDMLVVVHYGGMATYDFNLMTKLVLAAHALHVRVEVEGCGPRRLRIILHDRKRESEHMWERHPKIGDAIALAERLGLSEED